MQRCNEMCRTGRMGMKRVHGLINMYKWPIPGLVRRILKKYSWYSYLSVLFNYLCRIFSRWKIGGGEARNGWEIFLVYYHLSQESILEDNNVKISWTGFEPPLYNESITWRSFAFLPQWDRWLKFEMTLHSPQASKWRNYSGAGAAPAGTIKGKLLWLYLQL